MLNEDHLVENSELARHFFRPVCSETEIERIFSVSSGRDYLLKLRAETIVDHMRLFRVYRNKALLNEKSWSLESSFDSSHYDSFLRGLPRDLRARCESLTYGNICSNAPNGMIFKTDFGPVVTICDSLRFFLKFMHLGLLDFLDEVPDEVRVNGLRIGLRVMLKTEALDFFMDPRGILPIGVAKKIHAPIASQLEFIAGHEFAHFLLGHISDSDVTTKPVFHAIGSEEQHYKPSTVYNKSQKQELEADIQAIKLLNYAPSQQRRQLSSAILWFGCLDILDTVRDTICPTSPWAATHPPAGVRIDNLLTNLSPKGFDHKKCKDFLSRVASMKKIIAEDVSLNPRLYEFYGSVYLGKPNSEWRGPELVDRVDYY